MNIQDILNFDNMIKAWEKIRHRKSAVGLDELNIGDFTENFEGNINKLIFEIKNGLYKPIPVKVINEDKNIAILSLRDRFVQYAILNIINEDINSRFIASNFGYIQGRSVYQAVDYINNAIHSKVVSGFYKCDIKGFFSNIDHEILMNNLNSIIDDKDIVKLLEIFIRSEIMINDRIIKPEKGIIPGSPISPVLSNIYLCDTDTRLYNTFDLYARYSDDILIGNRDEIDDSQLLNLIRQLEGVKLSINKNKSGKVDLHEGFTFLGHDFKKEYLEIRTKGSLGILGNDIANDRFKDIFKYLGNMNDIEESGIKELKEVIVKKGERKYYVLLLILLVKNNLYSLEGHEFSDFIRQKLKIDDLNMLVVLIRNHEDVFNMLYDIVQFFINIGMFDLAEDLNCLPYPDKHEISNDIIPDEYRNRYINLFFGRKTEYARGYADVHGKRNYYRVNMGFTVAELEKMLEDRHSIGVFPLDGDDNTSFIVIDIDINKKILLELTDGGKLQESLLQSAGEFAFSLKEALFHHNIISYIEFSGYKGYHLWIFLSEALNVDRARRAVSKIIENVLKPEALNVEIIPSMYREDGEIIKVPLSYHELTNRQAVFIDDEGRTVENQMEFIFKINVNNIGVLCSIKDEETDRLVSQDKVQHKNILDFPQYLTSIYNRCILIKMIVDKSLNESYINHFERNALLYVFGHSGEGGREILHFVISKCLNYNFEVTEGFIARMKEKPVSCQKLKTRFPNYSGQKGCNCNFDEYPLFYPSPVIFGYMVEPELVTKPDYMDRGARIAEISKVSEQIRLNTLVSKLIDITRRKKEIEKELKICCEEIEIVFENKGVNEFEVDAGKLIKKGDEWYLRML